MASIRRGRPQDLPQVAMVQECSPEAAQWEISDYLGYDLRVAEEPGGRVVGFLVSRLLAADDGGEEHEILNLAVFPDYRRAGVGRSLLQALLDQHPAAVYLEVRESNLAARILYKSMGFEEVTVRPAYYETPSGRAEAAIVMKFHSC